MKKSKLYFFIIFLVVFFISSPVLAQIRTITGNVTSESEGILLGVNIFIKGSTKGTITNPEGNFSIDVKDENSVLVFSYIGYLSHEITVGDLTEMNITLTPNLTSMDEVVIIGYGSLQKRDLTGSIAQLTSVDFEKVAASSFEQGLAGQMSGVQITTTEAAPGAGLIVKIRGNTSINASSSPLYVIDGFPLMGNNESMGSSDFSSFGGHIKQSPLSTLNPTDIEKIEILKDASATSIYGSRGANGVVIITTKGGANKKPKLTFDMYYGIQQPPKPIDVLKGDEYVDFVTYGLGFDDFIDTLTNEIIYSSPSYNWQEEIYQVAPMQNYSLGIYGGKETLNYALSFGYFNQDGIIVNTNFKRYTVNVKLNFQVSKRFKLGISSNLGNSINDGTLSAVQRGWTRQLGPITYAFLARPVLSNDADGVADVNDLYLMNSNVSPLKIVNETVKDNNKVQSFLNGYAEYQFFDGLTFKSSIGGNFSFKRAEDYYPGSFGIGKRRVGADLAAISTNYSVNWLNENTLSLKKENEIHRVNAVVGFTLQEDITRTSFQAAYGFDQDSPDNLFKINEATIKDYGQKSNIHRWSMVSGLARLNYTLLDNYLFTASIRSDGSSRLSNKNKWATFPSLAFAWRLSHESFLQDVEILSNLKIRASYGVTGNSWIPLGSSLSELNLKEHNFNNKLAYGVYTYELGNKDLTWEKTTQSNIGLNAGFFSNRLTIETDYYYKKTTDLLFKVPIPISSGYEESWSNYGAIENKGVEFSLNTVNITSLNFTWSTKFNITFPTNSVIELREGVDYLLLSSDFGRIENDYILQIGEVVGSFYGYVQDGLYQESDFDENGILLEGIPSYYYQQLVSGGVKIKDISGVNGEPDGVIDGHDRTILGNANPDHFGGLINKISYKGIDLSIAFQWSYGNQVYNMGKALGMQNSSYDNRWPNYRDRWTEENVNSDVWHINGAPKREHLLSTYIEDGSYLRLSNISLGYNLPVNLCLRINIGSARVYIAGDNLFLWSKYSGYDPDVNTSRYGNLNPGYDFGGYPKSRNLRIGTSITF